MKKNKKKWSAKKLTIVMTSISAGLIALGVAASIVTTTYFDGVLRDFFKEAGERTGAGEESELGKDLDKNYNKSDFKSEEELKTYARAKVREMGAEGFALLKNDTEGGKGLPLSTSKSSKRKISIFSHSSVDLLAGGTGSGQSYIDTDLKSALEGKDYEVNSKLWDFYSTGNGKGYKRGGGVAMYGAGEDWSINECPISVLQAEDGLLESAKNTTAMFVISRTGGEGMDLGRSMQKFTKIEEDKNKSYLEPDSVELGVIDYLNTNFDNVILLVNTNNVMELGWVENYPNIKSVLWVPGAGGESANSIADVISGDVNPSGHLVDTMAYDAFSSPAMKNMGDFAYTNKGNKTGYYGVSYDEGIYVGYKYYETRYFDKVMNQGNAGAYDYSKEVQYPFGYGLSYTDFQWTNYKATDMNADGNITVSVDVKNIGDVAGKDAVGLYLNAPYTDFDKTNRIEKAAASLIRFEKTGLIKPGESETVTLTVNKEDFKSYDDVSNKTYILDDGDYNLTLAKDVHEAVNNILVKNGKGIANGLYGTGDASFVSTWHNDTLTKMDKSFTGVEITNHFDYANYIDRSKYLSRQDWTSTFPVTHGTQTTVTSNMSEVNGLQYQEEISDDLLADLKKVGTQEAARSPLSDEEAGKKAIEYGQQNGVELIDIRGQDYNDVNWDKVVGQMTAKEVGKQINQSGYTTPAAKSINKPKAVDLDGPSGMNNMVNHAAYSITYPSEVNIATTWNKDISHEHGRLVGNDGLLLAKAHGWYAPAMNIHRTPFAGRNFEYYSEDGVLSGLMAAQAAKGTAEKGVYSFLKHFALNDQENHRCDNGLATFCNEQAMREIYLKPFETVLSAGTVEQTYYLQIEGTNDFELKTYQMPIAQAIMSSFNRIGTTWAGGDYNLITKVLREEWGFNGMVLTDYSQGATGYMHSNQMLRAGADNQLSQMQGSYNIKGDANTYYTQQAMRHILYTVANSSAMNGFIHGTAVKATPFAYYYLIWIALDVIAVAFTGVSSFLIINRWKDEKKEKEAEKAN